MKAYIGKSIGNPVTLNRSKLAGLAFKPFEQTDMYIYIYPYEQNQENMNIPKANVQPLRVCGIRMPRDILGRGAPPHFH